MLCRVYNNESYALFEMLWKRETAGCAIRHVSYLSQPTGSPFTAVF